MMGRRIGAMVLLAVVMAWPILAQANGTVTQLAGTLTVQRSDGSARILSQKSDVKSGDTLSTEKDSYAQIKFADGATVTLKPNTAFKVEEFRFSEDKPEGDSAVFSLIKGGLRAVTGLVSKRGRQDAYRMNTATATIGIRGTIYDADDCLTTPCVKDVTQADGSSRQETQEGGVYVGVHDGEVIISNGAGSLPLGAGQFAMAPASSIAPRQLPGDPGLSPATVQSLIESISSGGIKSGMQCK